MNRDSLPWQPSESNQKASTQQAPSPLSECEANVKGLYEQGDSYVKRV